MHGFKWGKFGAPDILAHSIPASKKKRQPSLVYKKLICTAEITHAILLALRKEGNHVYIPRVGTLFAPEPLLLCHAIGYG